MKDKSLRQHYQQVMAAIAQAALSAGRAPEDVVCLAVSKTASCDAIATLAALGQQHFAENRLQSALPKMAALAKLDLCWHFIGPIQSNKAAEIATHFTWVQSVSREKIARILQQARAANPTKPPLQVCVQLKLNHDPHRGGVTIDKLIPFCQMITTLDRLQLRGLMCLPPKTESPAQTQAAFHECAQAFAILQANGFDLDTLSIGMSGDFALAIAEGSTMVRIGRAIFADE